MNRLRARLSTAIDRVYRTNEDRERENAARPWTAGESLLFVVSTTVLIATLVFLLAHEAMSWENLDNIVTLTPTEWHRWQDPVAEATCQTGQRCPANLEARELWTSPEKRKVTKEESDGRPFWLGLHLAPERLKEAREASAHYVVLGWVRGNYKLFINNELIHEGRRDDHEPIAVPFPSGFLSDPRGLWIALNIEPEPGTDRPDVFAKPLKEMITTARGAHAYATATAFYKKTRPFSLFFLNLAFALLFFFFWRTGRNCGEAYYLGLFLLVSAAIQLRLTDVFLGRFMPSTEYALDYGLRAAEATIGLLLSFSFARFGRQLQRPLGAIALLVALAAFFYFPTPAATRNAAFWIEQNLLAPCFFIGATANALQAWRLSEFGPTLRSRRLRLVLFAGCLFVIGLLYLPAAQSFSHAARAFVWRFGHFALLAFMGTLIIREIGEQRRAYRRMPVSKYHRKKPMPEKIEGYLITLDLKNSEQLSRLSAERGVAGSVLFAITNRLWKTAHEMGGVVVQSDGDQLKIFVERTAFSERTSSPRKAIDRLESELEAARNDLILHGALPETVTSLAFRAGVAFGAIRPLWQRIGNESVATWSEAGTTTPFVDSARLMEIERSVSEFADTSLAVLPQNYADRWPDDSASNGEIIEIGERTGKHGVAYQVCAYSPQTRPAPIKRAA